MIAVDTNVLVYAHREGLDLHEAALERLSAIAGGLEPWGLPVFCAGEFVRVVTHPKIFTPPSTLEQALAALKAVLQSPSLLLLSPGERYLDLFEDCVREADARGNLAFDAQIAAVCLEHGAKHILTADRDFSRFSKLQTLSITT